MDPPVLPVDANSINEDFEPKTCHCNSLNLENSSDKHLCTRFALLNSLPPNEAVISIEQIRKKILFYLNASNPLQMDLLKCRLVSRQWHKDVTKHYFLFQSALREIIIKKPEGVSNFHAINHYSKSNEPLSKLIKLMDSTSTNAFPCADFRIEFDNTQESETEIFPFLSSHGGRIKYLTLCIQCYQSCHEDTMEWIPYCPHFVNWLNKYITKILVEFVPNLVLLRMILYSHLNTRNNNFCDLYDKNASMVNIASILRKHSNLRKVHFDNPIPRDIWDIIFLVAQNLESIESCCDLDYLLQPINRLYLLKHFTFFDGVNLPGRYKISKRIANTDGELQIETFRLWIPHAFNEAEDFIKAGQTCYKIIEKSSNSLISLDWIPIGYLPGLKLPLMPKVKRINFSHQFGFGAPPVQYYLPEELLWAETVPKLRYITFRRGLFNHIPNGNDLFLGRENESVHSVKEIITEGNPVDLEKCQKLFPNAKIRLYFSGPLLN